jgi:phage tail-like protein
MANPGGRATDPLVGFQFRIEIDGGGAEFKTEDAAYFIEVSGLGSEHEVVEYTGVDEQGNPVVQKVPGRLKWEDVVLKRGITSSLAIWDWRKKAEDGKMNDARAAVSIIMMDTDGTDVARWDLTNAWPSKVSGPAPKSDSNEFAIEEMTIIHEGMERVS